MAFRVLTIFSICICLQVSLSYIAQYFLSRIAGKKVVVEDSIVRISNYYGSK
jgi:hypothetical protein